jgi:hypothetical protein
MHPKSPQIHAMQISVPFLYPCYVQLPYYTGHSHCWPNFSCISRISRLSPRHLDVVPCPCPYPDANVYVYLVPSLHLPPVLHHFYPPGYPLPSRIDPGASRVRRSRSHVVVICVSVSYGNAYSTCCLLQSIIRILLLDSRFHTVNVRCSIRNERLSAD